MAVLRVTAPIPPGLLAINGRDEVGLKWGKGDNPKRVIRKSDSFRAAEDELHLCVRQEVIRARWRPIPRLTPCYALVRSYWPEGKGDVDACSKAALDSLRHGGAIMDDDQIPTAVLERVWYSAAPRIELTLTHALAELVAILGWS